MSQIPQPNILQLDHRMAEKSRARGYMEKSLPMDPHNLHLFYHFFCICWELFPLENSQNSLLDHFESTKLLSSWNLDESLAMGSYGAIKISCSSVPLPLCKGHGWQEIDPPPIHSDEEVNFTCLYRCLQLDTSATKCQMGCQWIHSWLVKFGDVHVLFPSFLDLFRGSRKLRSRFSSKFTCT